MQRPALFFLFQDIDTFLESSTKEKLISINIFCTGRFFSTRFKKSMFLGHNYRQKWLDGYFFLQCSFYWWVVLHHRRPAVKESPRSLEATCHEMILKKESWSLDQFQDQCSAMTVSEHWGLDPGNSTSSSSGMKHPQWLQNFKFQTFNRHFYKQRRNQSAACWSSRSTTKAHQTQFEFICSLVAVSPCDKAVKRGQTFRCLELSSVF